jgi:hypothetical protein
MKTFGDTKIHENSLWGRNAEFLDAKPDGTYIYHYALKC